AQFRTTRRINRITLFARSTRGRLQYQHRKAGIANCLSFADEPMSVANGINRVESEAVSALRRCGANVMVALALLSRPARVHARSRLATPRRLAIAACVAVAVFVFL